MLLNSDQYSDAGKEKKLKYVEKQFFMEPPKEPTAEEVAASEEILKRLDEIDADEAEELLTDSSRRMFTDNFAYQLLRIVGDAQEAEQKEESYALGDCDTLAILSNPKRGECQMFCFQIYGFAYAQFQSMNFPVAKFIHKVGYNIKRECNKLGKQIELF